MCGPTGMFQRRGRVDGDLAAADGPQALQLTEAPEQRPAGFAGPLETWKSLSLSPQRKGQEPVLPEGPDSDPSEAFGV